MKHTQTKMMFTVADALLGEFSGLVPLAVQDDGNCLFHAASLLVFGREGHHSQLRSLTVEELSGHAEFYEDGFVARTSLSEEVVKVCLSRHCYLKQ